MHGDLIPLFPRTQVDFQTDAWIVVVPWRKIYANNKKDILEPRCHWIKSKNCQNRFNSFRMSSREVRRRPARSKLVWFCWQPSMGLRLQEPLGLFGLWSACSLGHSGHVGPLGHLAWPRIHGNMLFANCSNCLIVPCCDSRFLVSCGYCGHCGHCAQMCVVTCWYQGLHQVRSHTCWWPLLPGWLRRSRHPASFHRR